MNAKWKPNYKSTLHKDGSVSFFDIYLQQWRRSTEVGNIVLATLGDTERTKIRNHLKNHLKRNER